MGLFDGFVDTQVAKHAAGQMPHCGKLGNREARSTPSYGGKRVGRLT